MATRSVSLARIYEDLGFQQLALVEGWKSVNIDPTNYSAHRFLADSYGALQRSEIARLSELLLAQLLQPLNNNPVQPRLGESAPAILAGSGPVDPSFNEFSQLFIRDRLQLLAAGVAGENSTLGEEAIITGLHKRFSYNLGQFHHETDGYRTNADISQTIYNAFTQIALSPKASIQGEFRYNKTKRGDIELRFDPQNFSPGLRNQDETETYRLAFHYALASHSDVIASFFYQEEDEEEVDPTLVGGTPGSVFFGKTDDEGFIVEAQYLFHTLNFNLIAGIGHFDEDRTTEIDVQIPFFGTFSFKEESDIQQSNFYFYSITNLLPNVSLILGASLDLFEGSPRDRDQFNPKLGLLWDLTPSTTIRVAGMRSLKKSLLSKQTIEPTQVAGFQQFFDDFNGTDSRRYGLAIDQKFSSDLFGGLELSKRDVETPIVSAVIPGQVDEVDIKERLGRAYLFWTPIRWISASVEYQVERFDSSDPTQPFAPKVKTHRVPIGLNVYHEQGFFGKLKTTYVDQDGSFLNAASGIFEEGEDHFWVLDASIGYRLPKRLGIITVDAKNLLDEDFNFQDTDPAIPLIQPETLIFTKLTLAF